MRTLRGDTTSRIYNRGDGCVPIYYGIGYTEGDGYGDSVSNYGHGHGNGSGQGVSDDEEVLCLEEYLEEK